MRTQLRKPWGNLEDFWKVPKPLGPDLRHSVCQGLPPTLGGGGDRLVETPPRMSGGRVRLRLDRGVRNEPSAGSMSIRSRLRRGCRWTVHPGLGQRLSDVQRLTAHATVLGAGHREIVGLGPGGFPLDVTDPGAGVRDGFPPTAADRPWGWTFHGP